jgi:glycosyltransferase involved in cell wall biosynthesis
MLNNELTIGMNGSMLDEMPTGVGVYSFNLINNLSNLAVNNKWTRITVFTPTKLLLNRNLKIVKLSGLLQSSRHGKLAAFCRFIWNTFYYPVQARKFDLLISPTTHGSFLLKNQIITIHDLISLHYKNISPHQRFYFKYFLKFLIKRAKLIIAVSENTKKDIISFFQCPEEKIKVIYNGYDDSIYHPATESKPQISDEYNVTNYLLAVGPTYPHKNFERLIDAYNNLSEANRKKHPLVIAGGKKKYLNELKKYAEKSGKPDAIRFLNYVPIRFMPSLYREAFALVFPSLYEGFGIPLLEAMASGCPVITSNRASMPEVCGDAAKYFNPVDQFSITSAIQEIIMNDELRTGLIEKGFMRVKNFSWKKMAGEFQTEIEKHFINN